MARKLYDLYADWFLEALILRSLETPTDLTLAGGRQERRALTRDETADMLRLNAPRIEALAGTFRAVGTHPELVKDLERYLDTSRKVAAANDRFQEIVSRETPPEKELRKAGDRLKKVIAAREQVRADIMDRLRRFLSGPLRRGRRIALCRAVVRTASRRTPGTGGGAGGHGRRPGQLGGAVSRQGRGIGSGGPFGLLISQATALHRRRVMVQ